MVAIEYHLIVRHDPTCLYVFQPSTYLLKDVEVILNIFERAVIGKSLQECLSLFLGRAYRYRLPVTTLWMHSQRQPVG